MTDDVVDARLAAALHLSVLDRGGLVRDPRRSHVVVQSGTLQALMEGHYDGDVTIGELLEHGDLGIGTVDALGGELVVVHGSAFLVDAAGTVSVPESELRTPFAVMTRFEPTGTHAIDGPVDVTALCSLLDSWCEAAGPVASAGAVRAVRVDGTMRDLRLRSVHRQHPPYPPLTEVTAHQTEWSVPAAEGTIVGFRFPDAAAELDVPGHHLHFVSDDRRCGGHVLEATVLDGVARIDVEEEVHLELPEGQALAAPGSADRAAIRAAEGGS